MPANRMSPPSLRRGAQAAPRVGRTIRSIWCKEDSMAKSTKIGRSAVTGRFMPVKKAQGSPKAVVETIKRGKN